MYRYLLFDLDGTLTDPKVGITSSVQYALRHFGVEVQNLDQLEPFIGPPLRDSFMEWYGFTKEQAEEAVLKYRERFSTKGLYENEIYDGIVSLLQGLKEEGRQLAIASSKPTVFVKKILEHFSILEYFSVVVGSELDGTRDRKEEVVEEALKQLIATKQEHLSETVMIGDRKYDIQGAKEHGIASIGVTYGYGSKEELSEEGATYLVNSVEELTCLLGVNVKIPFSRS